MQQALTCPKCGSPNALGQRFCWNCGTTLTSSCPNCSAPMDPGSRFCGNCGAQLPPQQAGGWGQTPPQQSAWGQPPPPPPPQTGNWGQAYPQQGTWGQQPPQQQQAQQPGWGQPPPFQQQQAGAWGQPPPQQQAGWSPQGGPQPGSWNQEMPRQKGVGGLVLLLVVLLIFLGGFGYFAFVSKDKPWGSSSGGTGTTTSAITTGPFVFVKNIDSAASKAAMEIQWETNDVYKAQVEYGIDTKYGSTTQLEADYVKSHTAPIADLKLSTSYHYRITLKNKTNVDWKSDDMTFKTPNPAQ
jgi:hypothetical protein